MSSFRGSFNSWFQLRVNKMTAEAMQAVEDAVEAGENITKHHISTRGTAKSGKRGRIETGAMLDSVTHGVEKRASDEIIARFGYEDGPDWTRYQEPGFTHVSGVPVEGTYALGDAAEEVLQDLIEEIDRIVSRA